MYNGKQKSGFVTPKNDLKVIQSRIGCKIVMNDATGSVLTQDAFGNKVFMDGKGSISVDAPKNLTFTAGENISIVAGQNISSSAGMSMTEKATINHSITSGALMTQEAGGDYNLIASNILEIAKGERKSKAKDMKETSKNRQILSEENNDIHSQKTFNSNAGEKTKSY
jgi:type VI secretion system secreted protein VgrG